MSRYTLLIFILVLVSIAGATSWYLIHTQHTALAPISPLATSTVETRTGQAIYTNGDLGFSVIYPETVTVEDAFSATYHLPAYWRANALASGTPVVALIAYSTASDHSYPRYFVAMVRVGVSSDKKEIASCTKPSQNAGEKALPDEVINGTTWNVFSFGDSPIADAAAVQYVRGVSYRTIHEGRCVALEKIQTGSSYREDPKSTDDVSDAELQKQYEGLSSIIQSFTFARP